MVWSRGSCKSLSNACSSPDKKRRGPEAMPAPQRSRSWLSRGRQLPRGQVPRPCPAVIAEGARRRRLLRRPARWGLGPPSCIPGRSGGERRRFLTWAQPVGGLGEGAGALGTRPRPFPWPPVHRLAQRPGEKVGVRL